MNIVSGKARRPRSLPDDLRNIQMRASDPEVSAWVAANAGSGKTHVLAQRVVRLLLYGVDPSRILCITFTKAAAANMANRVFEELRRWTALDEASLDHAIHAICNRSPDAALRRRARRLFAFALDAPGGLKVQTIHAFCARLLHQFPFEANVAARFEVLDQTAQNQLLSQISLDVLLAAARAPDTSLGRALATAVATAADQTFKEVVAEAIRKRDLVRAWVDHAGGVDAAIGVLGGALGIAVDDSLDRVDREITEGPHMPSSQWGNLARRLEGSPSKSDREQAGRLDAALKATGWARTYSYLHVFFTGDLECRQRLITSTLEKSDPSLAQTLDSERVRLKSLLERRKAVLCRERTAALLTVAGAVISRYHATKDRRGLLDYEDLIDKTVALLGEGRAAWVHYKLDQGIDHILIDEAQDTSPKQWEIIRRLTGEFFAGSGARNARRTIFAVGDEKQSIFSFQNAAPRAFAEMLAHFQHAHQTGGLPLRYCEFKHSLRSGPNILAAVDKVFEPQHIHRSVTSDAHGVPPHIALPDALPGVVEIWETIKPQEKREIEAWDAPFDNISESSPQVRLASKIAHQIRQWTQEGTRAGDVLVLVRQRGPMFEAIIRALKDLHVPVAGADRLVLTEHIAVMDLMALADALLLPADDLALASVLKSPLFGLDEEELFHLAWKRRGSLREALRAAARNNSRYTELSDRLDRLTPWAMSEMPFAFYARVLGAEGGRRQFLARLGHEADDPIQEFLNIALDYERRETPSLQGFLAWLRAAETEIKRDMEITRDEVRVMTVHGAKGLEAPIVILADSTTPPTGPAQRQDRLFNLAPDQRGAPIVWAGKKTNDVAVMSAARERMRREAEDEYRRLLYVAMTRASDRLIVCGADGERKRADGCWWNLVANTLQPCCHEEAGADGDGKVWRYHKVPPVARAMTVERAAAALPSERPRSLDCEVAPPATEEIALSPSHAFAARGPVHASTDESGRKRDKAIARGVLIHRLAQALPELPTPGRYAAAARHLARRGNDFTPAERDLMAEQVCRLLEDPRFAELFSPGSRSELPIVARFAHNGRTISVSGQVDRLAVTETAVLIADFKTNHSPPRTLEDVPFAYVGQLALYRAALRRLYPERAIRAALVWTEIPELMEIPASMLDDALDSVTSV